MDTGCCTSPDSIPDPAGCDGPKTTAGYRLLQPHRHRFRLPSRLLQPQRSKVVLGLLIGFKISFEEGSLTVTDVRDCFKLSGGVRDWFKL